MSKYTVELREILEQGVDIGLKDYPIWAEDHRQELNTKIINHYKYREIGFETIGRFIDELNIKMHEIMPYYVDLYKTTLFEYNPIHNVDYTEEYTTTKDSTGNVSNTSEGTSETTGTVANSETGTSEGQGTVEGSSQSTSESTSNGTTNHKNKKVDIDTPQSHIDVDNVLETYPYASNVSSEQNDETTTQANTGSATSQDSSTTNTQSHLTNEFESETNSNTETSNKSDTTTEQSETETHTKHLLGNYGMTSSQTLIKQERELIINIDMQIIAQLRDLFMRVW